MCTVLADIHSDIEAVPQNEDINQNHRLVRVAMPDGSIRQCRGGIDMDHLLGYFRVELPKYFSSSFLSSLSAEYAQVNFTNIQDSFQNLRYKLYGETHTMEQPAIKILITYCTS